MNRDLIFKAVFGGLFVLIVVTGAVGWKIYAYSDCRNVGHSKLYCVVHFMSN